MAVLARDAATDAPASLLLKAASPSLMALVSSLAQLARQTNFRRLGELNRTMEPPAQVEVHRDVMFLPSLAASGAMLRRAAAELERLDAHSLGGAREVT
jgi:hypothetical protein